MVIYYSGVHRLPSMASPHQVNVIHSENFLLKPLPDAGQPDSRRDEWAGAEPIRQFFQLLGDWASNLCLSPEQHALRILVAVEFGLLAGIFGAAAAVVAVVTFGASAGIAAVVSIIAGIGATRVIDELGVKQYYLDEVASK